jgi:hypothetical protein
MEKQEPVSKAISQLGIRHSFKRGERDLSIACLIREADWVPLSAPWWRKKEACIIGADLGGNFFLRYCDGTVRYWEHVSQSDTIVAPSVREFVANIT